MTMPQPGDSVEVRFTELALGPLSNDGLWGRARAAGPAEVREVWKPALVLYADERGIGVEFPDRSRMVVESTVNGGPAEYIEYGNQSRSR